MDEQAIHDRFINGDLKLFDAIVELRGLGYCTSTAKRLTDEWIESAEEFGDEN